MYSSLVHPSPGEVPSKVWQHGKIKKQICSSVSATIFVVCMILGAVFLYGGFHSEAKRGAIAAPWFHQGSISHRIYSDPRIVHKAAATIGLNSSRLQGNLLEPPLLSLVAVATTASPTAEEESDTGEIINEAIGEGIDALADIAFKWMTGQSVSAEEYVGLAQTAIKTGLNIAAGFLTAAFPPFAPLIAFVASLFSKLIDFLFGWLFPKPPPPSTGQLIKSALAKHRMNENRDFWEGFADELRWMPGLFSGEGQQDAKTSWYLVLQHDLAVNKNRVFHKACLHEHTWDHDDCKNWIKDGMWEVMVPYAELHMTVLWEITTMTMTNPDTPIGFKSTQSRILTKRMQEIGTEYVKALTHAWEYFYPYRMSLIWDLSHREYAWDSSDYYHPFDFLHANVDRGYDELNLEMPVTKEDEDVEPNARKEISQVRNWGYKGCEGPRHKEVKAKEDPIEPNNACNLYHMITSAKDTGGCGCDPGETLVKAWYDEKVSSDARTCWKKCMSDYTAKADKSTKKGFKAIIDKIQGLIDKLNYPATLKFDLQKENTECEPQSVVSEEHCMEGFKALGIKVTGELQHERWPHCPVGCFLKANGAAVYNSAKPSADHPLCGVHAMVGHRPLCGAVFSPPP